LAERGDEPTGVNPEASAHVRARYGILPAGVEWRVAFEDEMKAEW
jgi:hypothetical protein